MIKKYVFVFLLLPCFALAADPEIDQLKQELRALTELYQTKINEVETRLAAIEAREKTIEAKVDQTHAKVQHTQSQVAVVQGELEVARNEHEDYPEFTTAFDAGLFDYYGYMRAGFGVNDDGTSQERFKLPGAGAAYRLGNETDTYVEMGFSYYSVTPQVDQKEAVFGTHLMLAYATDDKGPDVGNDVSIRQAFVTAKNVIPGQPDATLWGGQRYYRRHDVHMNDFYWLDMSGFGGGIEDYDLGFAKASLAWIGGTTDDFTGTDDYIGDLETTDKNNIDIRLNDIEAGIGKLNLWFDYSHYKLDGSQSGSGGGGSTDDIEGSADGYAIGFWLDSELAEGLTNIFAMQYGTSVAANFNSFSPSLRDSNGDFPDYQTNGGDVDDQTRFRVMDTFHYQHSERLSMQAFALYQEDDLGLDTDSDITWYSVGIRPVYDFTELYNLAVEIGYDYADTEDNRDGGLFKFTVAPGITPDFGFFSRPTIRLFFTYAQWSDAFEGSDGVTGSGSAYESDTSGITYGVQVESWW